MPNQLLFDVVLIGNYTKDTVITQSGTKQIDGGGFNYAAHVAAMMGLKTAAITRLSNNDRHVVENLQRLGVTVFPTYTPHSTEMQLHYPSENPDERTLRVTRTAGSFTPDQVRGIRARSFVLNGSIRGEIGLDVIKELRKTKALLAADAQGFIRILNPDGTLRDAHWPEREQFLSQVDILKADGVEAHALTGERDLHAAARTLAQLGPREIVLTHRHGVVVFAEGEFVEAEFCPRQPVGRSGRGDTCLAAYVAKRLTASPEEATNWAAAVTSLKLEAEGPIQRPLLDAIELYNRISKCGTRERRSGKPEPMLGRV